MTGNRLGVTGSEGGNGDTQGKPPRDAGSAVDTDGGRVCGARSGGWPGYGWRRHGQSVSPDGVTSQNAIGQPHQGN